MNKNIGRQVLFTMFVAFTMTASVNANDFEIAFQVERSIEDDFKKVDSSELTPKVVEEILKQYPTSKLAAVYKNNKSQFKLVMVLQSGTRRTVYIDANGIWFKKP